MDTPVTFPSTLAVRLITTWTNPLKVLSKLTWKIKVLFLSTEKLNLLLIKCLQIHDLPLYQFQHLTTAHFSSTLPILVLRPNGHVPLSTTPSPLLLNSFFTVFCFFAHPFSLVYSTR